VKSQQRNRTCFSEVYENRSNYAFTAASCSSFALRSSSGSSSSFWQAACTHHSLADCQAFLPSSSRRTQSPPRRYLVACTCERASEREKAMVPVPQQGMASHTPGGPSPAGTRQVLGTWRTWRKRLRLPLKPLLFHWISLRSAIDYSQAVRAPTHRTS
jgi:hypothetical protein